MRDKFLVGLSVFLISILSNATDARAWGGFSFTYLDFPIFNNHANNNHRNKHFKHYRNNHKSSFLPYHGAISYHHGWKYPHKHRRGHASHSHARPFKHIIRSYNNFNRRDIYEREMDVHHSQHRHHLINYHNRNHRKNKKIINLVK